MNHPILLILILLILTRTLTAITIMNVMAPLAHVDVHIHIMVDEQTMKVGQERREVKVLEV
jgi:hypothetical protein